MTNEETLRGRYITAMKQAISLPTHINGKLQNIYINHSNLPYKVMYADELTSINVFECLNPRYEGVTRFYIQATPTYRADGNMEKSEFWDKKLMHHRAWRRVDKEVKGFDFDIVGLKRVSSKLPAGVLIANIKFRLD